MTPVLPRPDNPLPTCWKYPGAVLAEKITIHLLREIVSEDRGAATVPLAARHNADMTRLQGRRVEGRVDRLDHELRQLLAWLDAARR